MNTAPKLHHLNAWDRPSSKPTSRIASTGRAALDEMLPDGGWPKHGVVEIIVPDDHAGAIDLVLPALRQLARQGRWIAMVTPPLPARSSLFTDAVINANKVLQVNPHPGRSALWTVESMLETGDCAAVLAWPGCDTELMDKRLQMAAVRGKSLCVLFRSESHAGCRSAVDVRLRLEVSEAGRAIYRLNSQGRTLSGTTL
ncbi:MAG: SulA-like leucine-rich domain-containing protein [Gammaproteobacteria bacterium]|nr:SulA-like leucine-rich domain-containing protein [Gammaproteobacteria bacterium]